MKKITKIFALLLALALTVVGMLALTGCDNGSDTVDIYITKADMPRVKYVEGQELDLSDGRLTVVTNGEETKLPLTAPEITVTGYDKNLLGEQMLTVQYGQITTGITVTVVPRMVAESFETKYFVGDVFNKKMGKLQITTDDMKTVTVNMSDDKVSVVNFDSSKAGMSQVTVSYTDGGNTYTCQFDVAVYEESNITFVAPYKTQYNSYDAGIDLSGGHFTVTSSDNKLTKQVPITEEMIRNFDLSAASIEHRDTPMTQTVTVEYLGQQFQYDIYIRFQGVSIVNYHAQNALANIDWEDAKANGLPADTAAAALDAIREYCNLPQEQLSQVSGEVRNLVARAGTIATVTAFYRELEKYNKTFAMDNAGNLYFICESYEQTLVDLDALNDPTSQINVYAAMLRRIYDEFKATMMDQELLIGDLICVYTEENQALMIQVLNHLTSVHSYVADVPVDWTVDMLPQYANQLMLAVMEIYNAGYYSQGYSNYYVDVIAGWREKGDMFDILYSYFLYHYENSQEFVSTYMWGQMPMPGLVEQWHFNLSSALGFEQFLAAKGDTDAFLYDLSAYMFFYNQALDLAEQIKSSGNQLWIDVYNFFDGDFMNQYYMYNYTCGYLNLVKGMEDSTAFIQLWDSYYEVLKLYNDGQLTAEKDRDLIVAMVADFQALSPTELLGFLSSLNYNYVAAKGSLPMLSLDEGTSYNLFSFILRDGYLTYMHEANRPLFRNLLLAMENYVLMDYKEGAMDQFKSIMQQLSADYAALSDADKADFDQYAGVAYQKYLMLYKLQTGGATVTLTQEEQALFNQLNDSLVKFFNVYMAIMNAAQNGQEVSSDLFGITFALYCRAEEVYNRLLTTVRPEALPLLYVQTYEFLGSPTTLAQAFYEADKLTVDNLSRNFAAVYENGQLVQVPLLDVITKYGIEGLLADMSEVLYQAYFAEKIQLDQAYVLSVMASVRNLTLTQKSLLPAISVDVAYYKAVNACLNSLLSAEAVSVQASESLFNVEIAYTNLTLNPTLEDVRVAFENNMQTLIAIYETLSDADKAILSDAYNYYLALYQQLKAA